MPASESGAEDWLLFSGRWTLHMPAIFSPSRDEYCDEAPGLPQMQERFQLGWMGLHLRHSAWLVVAEELLWAACGRTLLHQHGQSTTLT